MIKALITNKVKIQKENSCGKFWKNMENFGGFLLKFADLGQKILTSVDTLVPQ